MSQAAKRGVPSWALETVQKGKTLVEDVSTCSALGHARNLNVHQHRVSELPVKQDKHLSFETCFPSYVCSYIGDTFGGSGGGALE
eukprot:6486893-Amphidinium_carterae.1